MSAKGQRNEQKFLRGIVSRPLCNNVEQYRARSDIIVTLLPLIKIKLALIRHTLLDLLVRNEKDGNAGGNVNHPRRHTLA